MSEVLEQKRDVIMDPQNIGMAEDRRRDWVVIALEGQTVEDVLKPLYWTHKAGEFNPYDRIEVREETGAWMVELMVLRAERTWASVMLLQKYDLRPDTDESTSTDYMVKWGGPNHKWRVLKKSTGDVLHTKAESEEAALGWLRQYEATIRR